MNRRCYEKTKDRFGMSAKFPEINNKKMKSTKKNFFRRMVLRLRLLSHSAIIIMIAITQNLKVIDYDYLLILQLRLLKIIMCFSIATT